MDAAKETEIRGMLAGFLDNRYKGLKKITLSSLDMNPFLLRLMSKTSSINDAEGIVRWALGQRVERGTVTAFGTLIQKIAKIFSGAGTGVEGADISKEKDGRMHYIQVKSGPNTVNKDIASEISRLLRSASRRDPAIKDEDVKNYEVDREDDLTEMVWALQNAGKALQLQEKVRVASLYRAIRAEVEAFKEVLEHIDGQNMECFPTVAIEGFLGNPPEGCKDLIAKIHNLYRFARSINHMIRNRDNISQGMLDEMRKTLEEVESDLKG